MHDAQTPGPNDSVTASRSSPIYVDNKENRDGSAILKADDERIMAPPAVPIHAIPEAGSPASYIPAMGQAETQAENASPGASTAPKKRKLSPASREAKQQEKETKERQKLEDKAKKDEEKARREEDKRKRDAEREEERKRREEKKKVKDEERAAREEEKRKKDEERLKKERVGYALPFLQRAPFDLLTLPRRK
jgi:chromatin assembly factor 1 subunit A